MTSSFAFVSPAFARAQTGGAMAVQFTLKSKKRLLI
jgi:hypothetical protein